MVYYVVTADIVHPLDKLEQPLLRRHVKRCSVIAQRPYVVYLKVFQAYLNVYHRITGGSVTLLQSVVAAGKDAIFVRVAPPYQSAPY